MPFHQYIPGLNTVLVRSYRIVSSFLSPHEVCACARARETTPKDRKTESEPCAHRSYSQLAKAPIGFLWEMHVLAIHTPCCAYNTVLLQTPLASGIAPGNRRALHDHFRLVRRSRGSFNRVPTPRPLALQTGISRSSRGRSTSLPNSFLNELISLATFS